MTQDIDPWEERRKLTFEQAEGAAPLPRQLKLKEVTPEMRAVLWKIVHSSLQSHKSSGSARAFLDDPWDRILQAAHVLRDHRMIDDYNNDSYKLIAEVRSIFEHGDYLEIFGWLEFVLKRNPPYGFPEDIAFILEKTGAAYRVIDKTIIVPFGSHEEEEALKTAMADLANTEFRGAKAHLRNAAQLLSDGKNADSIRESIHAVESVVRTLEDTGKFSTALARLSQKTKIHASMLEGFKKLYGYTSDENGIRHPLLDDAGASVDETDALFMIGACASFLTYLINKSRNAGLIS
ncbi:AbiJ-NTD4 domain-containing protein [uncultured Roseibium sp.]|uniref:AbiJ-NTD4 domain-containing protein n=1 Tax=uncultured Roseibium sp. TaxID=1936171 RepID=UPI00261FE99C|nr:hypothetical protein [uncultured Roseibium sp.]